MRKNLGGGGIVGSPTRVVERDGPLGWRADRLMWSIPRLPQAHECAPHAIPTPGPGCTAHATGGKLPAPLWRDSPDPLPETGSLEVIPLIPKKPGGPPPAPRRPPP